MSKISIFTLVPKHSFHLYLYFYSLTSKLTLKKTETIKTRKQYKNASFVHTFALKYNK
jgi:hypothetical protein